MESETSRQEREAAEARERLERAARARSDLFEELIGFARETGFLKASLRDGALTLSHGPREVRFVPVGDADHVDIGWAEMDPEERHRLYVEEQLGGAWVWARKRRMRPREDRELFWDAGLEELLVRALGLPRPDDQAEPDDDDDPGSRGRSL